MLKQYRHLKVPVLTLLARIAFSGQQWGTIALIALNHDDEALGLFGLSLALVTTLNALFNLGLRQGLATDINRMRSLSTYFALRLLSIALSIAVIPVIIGIFWPTPNLGPMVLAVMFVKSVDLLSEFTYGIMQLRGTVTRIAVSQLLRAAFGLLAFYSAYEFLGSAVLAATAWALTWLVVWMAYDVPASNLLGKLRAANAAPTVQRSVQGLMHLTLIQLPFGVAAFAGNVGLAAPRVFLEHTADLTAVGIFTALWTIFQAGEAFVVAILHIYLTPLAKAMQSGNRAATLRIVLRLLALGASTSLLGILIAAQFGAPLLDTLYGNGFGTYAQVFTMLSIGWSIRYLADVLRIAVTAQRHFWDGAKLDALGSAFMVVAGIALSGVGVPMMSVSVAFAISQALLLATLVVHFLHGLRKLERDT